VAFSRRLLGISGPTGLSSRRPGWRSRPPPLGLPVLHLISMYTHAFTITPAGPSDDIAHRFRRWQPSPKSCWVGSCIVLFEACSAFTRVTACVLAESPKVTLLHQCISAKVVTSLHCSDCYRLERPIVGRELHPLKTNAFARHTRFLTLPLKKKRFIGVYTTIQPTVGCAWKSFAIVITRFARTGP